MRLWQPTFCGVKNKFQGMGGSMVDDIYEPPSIVPLGTVSLKTRGTSGVGTDGQFFFSPLIST